MRKPVARCLAVLLGLAPFALAEGALRVAGWPDRTVLDDPLVGFAGRAPLFVLSADGSQWRVDPARERFFAPQSFAASKPPGALRVFCLGGSTVQGRPWSTATAFPRLLELALEAGDLDRSRDHEVVNCGGISYASYRLVPLAEEVLAHQPDVLVLCTGHNEFLEARSYPVRSSLPRVVTLPMAWLAGSATFDALQDALGLRPVAPRTQLPAEVDTMLDRLDGLADFDRSDAWRRSAVDHFTRSVERILTAASARGVPVVVVSPPARLRDCPPFLGGRGARSAYAEALHHEAVDDHAAARTDYLRAKDLDAFPLRILEPMRKALHTAARRHDAAWLDADRLLARRCELQIVGPERLVDHVHPSLRAHQEVALALAKLLADRDLVRLSDDWRDRAETTVRAHLAQLDPLYFAKATAVLDGLERWSRRRLAKLERED